MCILKAKELDRLGNNKMLSECEDKIKRLQYEKETLEKETQRAQDLEDELNFFKNSQDEHFQQFEEKFTEISKELRILKNENNMLRKNEASFKDKIKNLTNEKENLMADLQNNENVDVNYSDQRLTEIESMLKSLMDKSIKESRDEVLRKSISDNDIKNKKSQLIHDLQGKIQRFKEDYNRKKVQKGHYINE